MSDQELFSGNINIEYGQFYIDAPDFDDDEEDYLEPESAFEGQENGICGVAQEGKMFFVVGPQNGIAEIKINLYSSEPEIDESYEEIVQVPFKRLSKEVSLCEWGCEETYSLDIPEGSYQVRYSIIGMSKDYSDDSDWDAPIQGQKHFVQIWPSEAANEKVIKVTSESAAYWHKEWGSQ
jgi:hypothetical protein